MGHVAVIGKGLMGSRNAIIDQHSEVVETPQGKALRLTKVVEILDPFGDASEGDEVEYAFLEDGVKLSGKGKVVTRTEIRCVIEIKEQTDNYQEIVRRALEWQV